MGGTSNKEQQHQERANQASIEDLQQLQTAKQISSRLYHITKNIYQHCIEQQFDQLANDFKTLTYDIPNCNLPLCLKKSKRYYLCRSCFDEEVCVCDGCFQVHKHANHNYVLVESDYPRICCCGNAEIIADPPCCQAHRCQEPMLNEQSTELFKNQLKYLVKLALPLAHSNSQVKISQKFRSNFIFQLLTFVKGKITNNNVIAQLVENIFLEASQFSAEQRTVLEQLGFSEEDDNVTQITEILHALAKSTCKKDRITKFYFNLLLNHYPQNMAMLKIIGNSGFKAASFPKTYQRYFQISQNCRFFMRKLDTKNLDQVYLKHEKLVKQLGEILLHSNRTHLLLQIFKKTKFTELLNFQNYYLANNQAQNNINKINIHFSLLFFKIIRVLAQTEEGIDLIKRNISDIYQQINSRKTVTFDRSLERTFSFAIFTLFKLNLPKKAQLQKLLGTQIQPAVANNLIIKSVDFKNSFTKQYRDLVAKGDALKLQGKLSFAMAELIATDELYIKIMASCLSEDYLFREYIELKLGEQIHKDELSLKNVREPLRKMPELFKNFEIPLQNNMAQLILSANSSQKRKESEIVLYNLLIGCQNILSAKFKAIADQFISCEDKIVQFIKNNSLIQNKKIKAKPNSIIPLLSLSPDSEYYFEHQQNQAIQRLVQYKLSKAEVNQCYHNIFNSKTLKSSIKIWQTCATIIQNENFDSKKNQNGLIATILTLCNLFFGTKLPQIKQLIQKISSKIISPNSKIQIYLKHIVQAKGGEEKEKHTSDKKRQMINALKQKQKNALQNFKLQEKCNIDLQCIFCKNSIQGEPYLLGHFRYNNFYSKKILEVNTPFMEFTTCGHSAHEKCLIQMHKGDFRIWYPCILCKSITNILLPIANTQLNQEKRLQKILDFLKNFAANYTFFFEANKQLVEFDLNDIIGVYKLLFKTMAYELTIYPIANFSYFQRSQLPLLKFIFDLLLFSYKKLRNLPLGGQYVELKANNDFNNIFNYHKYQLEAFITGNQSNLALQRKIDVHRDRIPEELTLLFDQIYEYLTDERDRIDYELKQTSFKDSLKVLIFKPPQDLNDLRKKQTKCKACSSTEELFQICLLCEWSCCSNCKDIRKVHALQAHLGQTVFLSGFNGKYTYIHEQLIGEYNSIYVDYLGHEANDKKVILPNEFTISESGWVKIVNDIICNRLHKEIMRVHT